MSMVDVTSTERRIADRVDPGIANQIAVSDTAGGVAFRDAGEMMEFAKMMAVANSGVRKHLRGNPGACLAILTQALEWGMSPFAVANKSYFVNDQIAFESQLVQAVILKRAPIKGRIKFEYSGEGEGRKCRAWARLRDDDEVVEYTSPAIKDIKVKNSPLWTGDPDQQLAYFSGRSLCRRHFPDVLLGAPDRDEIEEAPRVGPDRARDVTPARTLSGRLDALAAPRQAEPERAGATAAAGPTPHDPVTGEVANATAATENSKAPSEDGKAVTDDSGAPDDTEPEDNSPKAQLLDRLRSRAMQGSRKLRLAMGGLKPDERVLITDDDWNALEGAALYADGKGGGA